MIKKALTLLILSQLIIGCSWKAYDPENPEEYDAYWSDEKNRKQSILYPLSEELKEEELERIYGDEWYKRN